MVGFLKFFLEKTADFLISFKFLNISNTRDVFRPFLITSHTENIVRDENPVPRYKFTTIFLVFQWLFKIPVHITALPGNVCVMESYALYPNLK